MDFEVEQRGFVFGVDWHSKPAGMTVTNYGWREARRVPKHEANYARLII
jgi:hypothetical protein